MRLRGSLIEQYRQIHRGKRFDGSGACIYRYVDDITSLVERIPTQSILDYGCGKGLQYTRDRVHEAWGVTPTLFDPGVSGINELPNGTFDGVICTGVLEHIPEDEIPQALENLARYARKWCFLVIGIRPSNKLLPDGRGVHVTVRPPSWWQERVDAALGKSVVVDLRYE